MNDEQTLKRWFAQVNLDDPRMQWLFERARITRCR